MTVHHHRPRIQETPELKLEKTKRKLNDVKSSNERPSQIELRDVFVDLQSFSYDQVVNFSEVVPGQLQKRKLWHCIAATFVVGLVSEPEFAAL